MTNNCGNYTLEELDWALDHLLPSVSYAKGQGITFQRPELVKMVAWNQFVLEYSLERCYVEDKYPKYPKAMYIVQLAASDLHIHGYFKF